MRFTLEHSFAAPVDEVVSASNSTEFQERLDALPNLGERRVTALVEHPDGSIERTVRYVLGAKLPAPVVAVIGETASWDEIGRFDPSTRTWVFEIRPHVLAGRFECRGSYGFVPDGAGTRRVVEVDVRVKVPLVGRRVESEIRKGLTETLEAEAGLLEVFLAERRADA